MIVGPPKLSEVSVPVVRMDDTTEIAERVTFLASSILGDAPKNTGNLHLTEMVAEETAKLSNRWQKATGMTLEQAEERSTWKKLKEEFPPEKVMAMENIRFKVGDWVRLKTTGKKMRIQSIDAHRQLICDADNDCEFVVCSDEYDTIELTLGFTS
jgi:hypothetical protein